MLSHTIINDKINLYRFGKPFNTDAVLIKNSDNDFKKTDKLKYFKHKLTENEINLSFKMNPDHKIFGLGESLGALDKRGRKYRMYSNDDPLHTPEKESLYSNHPFIIIEGETTFGLFIDCPSEIIFDLGYNDKNLIDISIKNINCDIYIIDTNDKLDIIKNYLTLTGAPFIPPKWAFGYQQSRWSYPDEKSVKKIADNFRNHKLPCDAIYLDIDYMDNYKVFTVDNKKFPDLKKFVKELNKMGIKLVPIIDPGVKIEKNYSVYEDGVKNNYFCKTEDGSDFTGTVWPGFTHFPDFLNSKTREWWGNLYKVLTDAGITGFWNDMNEPAIFFTKRGLNEFKESYEKIKDMDDIGFEIFSVKDKITSLPNNGTDYKSFYHKSDDGEKINHHDVHNLYGYNMTRSTADGLKNILDNKRYFLLSRSSYCGMQRYASIWMGDNQSWWEHMIVNIRMLQSLNICGFFYTGADTGGFGSNSSADLVIRWMQLGIFSPFFRNHSAIGTREQEPWAFDKETLDILRDVLRVRYALIPYIYSEYMRSVIELKPMILPLQFIFNDEICKNIEDQFMFGNSIMVAPIYQQNANGRFVHLPESKWLLWNIKKYDERNLKVYEKGDYFIESDISQIPVFIKENSLLILTEAQDYVGQKPIEKLTIIGFVTQSASFTYYDDDGETYNYKDGEFSNLTIYVDKNNDRFEFSFDYQESHEFPLVIKSIDFEIYDENGKLYKESIKVKE